MVKGKKVLADSELELLLALDEDTRNKGLRGNKWKTILQLLLKQFPGLRDTLQSEKIAIEKIRACVKYRKKTEPRRQEKLRVQRVRHEIQRVRHEERLQRRRERAANTRYMKEKCAAEQKAAEEAAMNMYDCSQITSESTVKTAVIERKQSQEKLPAHTYAFEEAESRNPAPALEPSAITTSTFATSATSSVPVITIPAATHPVAPASNFLSTLSPSTSALLAAALADTDDEVCMDVSTVCHSTPSSISSRSATPVTSPLLMLASALSSTMSASASLETDVPPRKAKLRRRNKPPAMKSTQANE